MKIKNNRTFGVYIGYKGIRPGFRLEAGATSKELPSTAGLNKNLQRDAQEGTTIVLLNDADKRFLGDAVKYFTGKADKAAKPAPAPVVEEEVVEELPEEEPEVVEEVVVEEPEVIEEEVVEEEEAPEEEVSADTEATPIDEPEEAGFELPKAPSKMTKADWMGVGTTEEVGLKNEINLGMTKTQLHDAVMARLEELGLI